MQSTNALRSPRVGFIGLGIMGLPMAGHLLTAGYPVVVHSRTKSKTDDLISRGATWADSPAAAAAGADVVFICVTDTPDVEAVLFGDAGVIQSTRSELIVVDHSTISPGATRGFAEKLAEKGAILLDAPVSGGDIGAKNATLSIMVGGDPDGFEKVLPLLKVMGKTITHCGPSGSGQMTKLVNQILVSVTNLAVCEALTLAIAGGLDPAKTITAVGGGAAGSWQLNNLGPRMIAGGLCAGVHDRTSVQRPAAGTGSRGRCTVELANNKESDRLIRQSARGRSGPRGNSGIVFNHTDSIRLHSDVNLTQNSSVFSQ